ncbi:MAG: electron transfer flavoprotein subunit alpha/FixB family protein [Chloroflexota bacterium]|nr:MAG: electron transfer flavoprotein subunit alpha/FixB family protein [Chloroflexota bacterium]
MSNNVWVYIDQFKGEPLQASWEVIGVGRTLASELGGGLTAVVIGSQVELIAQKAIQYGADEVLLADDPSLDDYRPEPYVGLIAKLAREGQPQVLLFPTTSRGRELAGMSAVDLNTGVLVDVVALEVKDGTVYATRPVYAGKLLSKVQCQARPQIITTRVRAFPKPAVDESRTGTVTRVSPVLTADQIPTEVVGYAQSGGGVSLTDAAVIVSGGRGVSNNPSLTPPAGMNDKDAEIWRAQQGFKLVGDLAAVLNGAVGASRAAVDAGYVPYQHQVGQTGKVVSPDLYVACGISGAIQHQAGMRSSKVIVAINKDPEAPIFKMARYGVVGDLYKVLPALTEALRKRMGK